MEPVYAWLDQHPDVLLWAARLLMVAAAWEMVKAARLEAVVRLEIARRSSDAARAASEALGG